MGRYGFHGTTVQPGVAGHGSASPFDIHNTLVSVGHDVEAGVESAVPSGNVDFALTFPPHAGLGDGPDPSEVPIESSAVRVESPDGRYRLTAVVSQVDGRTYLDYTTVTTVERPRVAGAPPLAAPAPRPAGSRGAVRKSEPWNAQTPGGLVGRQAEPKATIGYDAGGWPSSGGPSTTRPSNRCTSRPACWA